MLAAVAGGHHSISLPTLLVSITSFIDIRLSYVLLFDFAPLQPQMGLLNNFSGTGRTTRLYEDMAGKQRRTAMICAVRFLSGKSTGYVAMLFINSLQKIPGRFIWGGGNGRCRKAETLFYITVPQVMNNSSVPF